MWFFMLFAYIFNGGGVTLESEIIIIIQCHFLVMILTVQIDKSLNNLHLHIGGREPIIVFLLHMDRKLMAKSTDSHGFNIGIWDFTFNAGE